MAALEGACFYAFYWAMLFGAEERLWAIVSAAPVRVWRSSWYATWPFVPLHVLAFGLFAFVLPASAARLRAVCAADPGCFRRLGADA